MQGEVSEQPWQRHASALFLGSATVLAIIGFILGELGGGLLLSRGLLLVAIILGGWKIFLKAFHAIRSFSLDMNVLMTAAVIGALCIGKWAEGASVILLFGLSLALESYSVSRTRRAIRDLMSNTPVDARVLRNGKEKLFPLLCGWRLWLCARRRIGLDG
jgi:Cd2+/Zn2+-exporting ATPase